MPFSSFSFWNGEPSTYLDRSADLASSATIVQKTCWVAALVDDEYLNNLPSKRGSSSSAEGISKVNIVLTNYYGRTFSINNKLVEQPRVFLTATSQLSE